MRKQHDKYLLYQRSVQDPPEDCELYAQMFQQIHPDREAKILREDFCGTFSFSCAWVKRSPEHRALALDLDPEPLAYGRKNYWPQLTADEKKRLTVLKKNVISVTDPLADIIVAGNFSFLYLKEFETLVDYFKKARASLKPGGTLFLETAGGSEFTEKRMDRRTVKSDDTGKFIYFWEQKSFEPISCQGSYAIHFQCADGRYLKDAFTYEWRLWTIPEVRLALKQAGFKDTRVFWEKYHHGEGTGEYRLADKARNVEFFLSYVVGVR